MVPATRPQDTDSEFGASSKSCYRSALLASAGKNERLNGNLTPGRIDLEDIHMEWGDAKQRNYFSEPRTLDVCCGRGKGSFRQPGNLIFQEVVQKHLPRYIQADSKTAKGAIVSAIVNSLVIDHRLRFIKKDPTVGKWYALSSRVSHEKTGHAIRDQLTRMRKQSPLQENTLSSTPTTNASSVSSKETNKREIGKKTLTKVVSRRAKHQINAKQRKQPTVTQQHEVFVAKQEPGLLRFHLVSPEEEDDLWSDHVSCTDTTDPSSSWGGVLGADMFVPCLSSGDDDVRNLDDHQYDDPLANDVMNQHSQLLRPGTLPKDPPATPSHFNQHIACDGDMRRPSGVTQALLGMVPTTNRRTPRPRVSPENKACVLPALTLQRNHAFDVNEEYVLEPFQAQYGPAEWHSDGFHTAD